jgi:predicted Zn-dependent peptidase
MDKLSSNHYSKVILENGIPLVMERMDTFRSVSLGIWVTAGSRNEAPAQSGISHFIEHMFFKGTQKRSARDIAVHIDSLGGELNAFTAKEGTTYYVKVLDDHLEKGLELLDDIFLNSTFPEDEIAREADVVVEEIRMVQDVPEDYVHDLFSLDTWGGEGLGQPVLGSIETVTSFKRSDLMEYIETHYGNNNIVIGCAGNFRTDDLVARLSEGIGRLARRTKAASPPASSMRSGIHVYPKDLSEVHICLGMEGISQASPDRYGLLLLNTILGGGISSRLFQEVREKRGLAYSVYSFLSSFADAGCWAVYAGTGHAKAAETIEILLREFRGLRDIVDNDELDRAREQIKGGLMLGLESTSRRMQNIANQEIYYGRHFSPEEIMRAIDAVTLSEARALFERLIEGKDFALTVLGPVEESEIRDIVAG